MEILYAGKQWHSIRTMSRAHARASTRSLGCSGHHQRPRLPWRPRLPLPSIPRPPLRPSRRAGFRVMVAAPRAAAASLAEPRLAFDDVLLVPRSPCLVDYLKQHGFEVEEGVAGLETVFVARYGGNNGAPNLGIIV